MSKVTKKQKGSEASTIMKEAPKEVRGFAITSPEGYPLHHSFHIDQQLAIGNFLATMVLTHGKRSWWEWQDRGYKLCLAKLIVTH